MRSTNPADSVLHNPNAREVLISQQLFVVNLSPVKGKKAKKKMVNVTGELRDAFKIILYDKDTSRTELDWVICPDGKCPSVCIYESGTAEYDQLTLWIDNAKKWQAKMNKESEKIMGVTAKPTAGK